MKNVECLFNIDDKVASRFGLDENGLLTADEKKAAQQKNPYVGILKCNNDKKYMCQIHIPQMLLDEELPTYSWYNDALRSGKLNANSFATSRDAVLTLAYFDDEKDVLKYAWMLQKIKYDNAGELVATFLKAKLDNTLEENVNMLLKDCPKFEHPALKAYDAESFKRMMQVQRDKYGEYIAAFNRRFNNVYSKIKDKNFSAASDKLTLLSIMSESKLEFLEEEAKIARVKKKGTFDVNEFILKALQKNNER